MARKRKLIWRCLGCGKTFEGTQAKPQKCPMCGDDDKPEFKAESFKE